MQNVLSPMLNMYQNQLEASRKFADAVLSGAEKIDRVMIGATRHAVTEQLNFAQTIAGARDPRSVGSALQSTFMSRNPEDAVNYQRELMRIFSEIQSDIGRSVQDYIENIGSNAATSAVRPVEAAQQQANDAVFNPMTSMFSVWESAFKDVAAMAKKNMSTARSTMDDMTTRSMQSARNYADVTTGAAQQTAESVAGAATQSARNAMSMGEDIANLDERKGSASSGTGKKK